MDPFSADISLWKEHLKLINQEFIKSITYISSFQWFDLNENFRSKHNGFVLSTNRNKTFVYGEKACQWISLQHQPDQPQEIEILDQKTVKQVVYGDDCFAILIEDGSVYFGGEANLWNTGRQLIELHDRDHRFKQICCGYSHLLLLTTENKLMGMGRNYFRQISGTISFIDKLVDINVMNYNVIQISCGYGHSLALTDCHEVYAWGWNENGQLGSRNNQILEEPTLIKIPESDGVKIQKIAAGPKHSLFLMENGILFGCGSRTYGPDESESHRRPIEIILKNVTAITSGWSFPISMAFFSEELEDKYWFWGQESDYWPILIESVESFSEASASYYPMPITFGWTKIIKSKMEKSSSSDRIPFWAKYLQPVSDDLLQSIVNLISVQYSDFEGQFIHRGYIMQTMQNQTLIYGEEICSWISLEHQNDRPQLILENQNVIQVDYGYDYFIMLTKNGSVYLGAGRQSWQTNGELKQISGNDQRFKRICCGYQHLLLLTNGDRLMAMGWNQFGQITGEKDSFGTMIDTGLENVSKMSCGWQHSLALTNDGKVYAWGCYQNGRLGLGGQEDKDQRKPTQITSFSRKKTSVKDIVAGISNSLFLMENGTLYVCGNNDNEELRIQGDYAATPLKLEINGLQAIRSGWSFRFTIASTIENVYYVWGKLGDKTLPRTRTGEQVETFPEAFHDQCPNVPPMTFGWLCLAKNRDDFMKITRMQLSLWKEHLKTIQNEFLKSITHFIRLHYFDENFQHHDNGYLMCNNQNQLFVYGEEICQWLRPTEHQPNQRPQEIENVDNKIVQQVGYGRNYLALLMTDGSVYLCAEIDSEWATGGRLKLLNNDNQQRFKQISCGHSHLLLLTTDNQLKAMGSKNGGKITGTNDSYKTMVDIDLENVIKMDCGADHSLAMTTDGQVYSWGSNDSGRLGVGDLDPRDEPTLIQFFNGIDSSPIKDFVAGDMNSFFLMENGELYGCGSNEFGELVCKDYGHYANKPRKIPVEYVTAIASGWSYNFIMVFTVENHCHVWGRLCDKIIRKNRISSLPMESFSEASNIDFKIPLTFGWTRIGKSSLKTLNKKLMRASSVKLSLGQNWTGIGKSSLKTLKLSLWQKPLQSIFDMDFLQSITHHIALNWLNPGFIEQYNGYIMATNEKKMFFYGPVCQWISLEHEDGQPQSIQNPCGQNLIQVDYGSNYFAVLMADGSVFLGSDSQSDWKTNGKLKQISKDVKRICCGYQHLLLLTNGDRLMAMGWNKFGQITGKVDSYQTMVDTGLKNVNKMSCGWQHSLALTNDGEVYSWGTNSCGQLGLGDETENQNQNTPKRIPFLPKSVTIKDVMAASRISVFQTEDGILYGCGINESGQLGLMENCERFIFTPILMPMENVVAIVSGWSLDFSMAFTMNNSFYIWGLLNELILRKPSKIKKPVETFSEASSLYIEMPLTFGWSETLASSDHINDAFLPCHQHISEPNPQNCKNKRKTRYWF